MILIIFHYLSLDIGDIENVPENGENDSYEASNDDIAIEFALNNKLGETQENGKASNDDITIELALNNGLGETQENGKASNDDIAIELALNNGWEKLRRTAKLPTTTSPLNLC